MQMSFEDFDKKFDLNLVKRALRFFKYAKGKTKKIKKKTTYVAIQGVFDRGVASIKESRRHSRRQIQKDFLQQKYKTLYGNDIAFLDLVYSSPESGMYHLDRMKVQAEGTQDKVQYMSVVIRSFERGDTKEECAEKFYKKYPEMAEAAKVSPNQKTFKFGS